MADVKLNMLFLVTTTGGIRVGSQVPRGYWDEVKAEKIAKDLNDAYVANQIKLGYAYKEKGLPYLSEAFIRSDRPYYVLPVIVEH